MKSKNLAIMFTDMKGFTSRTSKQTRSQNEAMLRLHRDLLAPIIENHHGTIIKSIGDSFLISFESCTNAVLAGIDMQKHLAEKNTGSDDEDAIEIRVAISAGDVRLDGNDVFGDAVNIAARLCGITRVHEIQFTDSVFFSMNRSEIPFAEEGNRDLDGIPYPVRVYRAQLPSGRRQRKPLPFTSLWRDEEFLRRLGEDPVESLSMGGMLERSVRELQSLVAEKKVRLQIQPPRRMVPPICGNETLVQRAIQAILTFVLPSMPFGTGRLEIRYDASGFRSADIASTHALPQWLKSEQPQLEGEKTSAIRGHLAAKLEICYTDTSGADSEQEIFPLWKSRYLEKEMGLDFSLAGVYKIVQTLGGTLSFEVDPGHLSSFLLKLPADI